METTPELIERLKLDVIELRAAQDRTGKKALRPLRWEGTKTNPNGYRTFGDLTNGRSVRCMTCGNLYNGGKNDHRGCPYCSGSKPMLAPKKAKGNKYAN